MTTTSHEQPPALSQDNYGALAYMLTFEEIDDAIDVLERIISARENENKRLNLYSNSVHGGLNINAPLETAIDQLRAERSHRAIPEDVMDAAIDRLHGEESTEDTESDDGQTHLGGVA